MHAAAQSQEPGPFIAWCFAQELTAPSVPFRQTCEKHLRSTMALLSPELGTPAMEGIILYDRLERGAAVVDLLWQQGSTLPKDANGESCDRQFDEDKLCRLTNAYQVFAGVHEGTRGMLITLNEPDGRRFMLLEQREASMLHPFGHEGAPEKRLSAIGLIAHEMMHARDYADGRPGRPSLADVSSRCAPQNVDAISAIADMALAEYVATRAECAAQVALGGACSSLLTDRITTMSRQKLEFPPMDARDLPDDYNPEQRKLDLGHLGNVLGTLSGYAAADAPVMREGGALKNQSTSAEVRHNLTKDPALSGCIEAMMPALERAASAPDAEARKNLAGTLESALIEARCPKREQEQKRGRSSAFDDWFDTL